MLRGVVLQLWKCLSQRTWKVRSFTLLLPCLMVSFNRWRYLKKPFWNYLFKKKTNIVSLWLCLFSISWAVKLLPRPPLLAPPVWTLKGFLVEYAWSLFTDALIWRTTRGRTWTQTPSSVLIATSLPPPGLRLRWVSNFKKTHWINLYI